MVRAYLPQVFPKSISSNSNKTPQGFPIADDGPELVATYNVGEGTALTAIKFNKLDPVDTRGTKMYIISAGDDLIRQYDLVNPFDVTQSNVTLATGTFDTSGFETVPTGMAWSADGENLFVVGDQQGKVFQFEILTDKPYDLGDVSEDEETNVLDANMGTPTGIVFNDDSGSRLYISGALPNQIVRQFTLGTDYSVQGVNTNEGFFPTTPEVTNARSVEFAIDGKKMFLVGRDTDKVFQYSVQNAFDITTGTVEITAEFSLAGISTSPLGLAFSNDGFQMFVLDSVSKKVFQFTLPSKFQL